MKVSLCARTVSATRMKVSLLREDSIGHKNESIPLRKDSIGYKNESVLLRKDSISYKNESVPLRKDYIGNSGKMRIPERMDCISNSKNMCIPVSEDCIGNTKLKLGFEKECTTVVAALNLTNENRLKLKQDDFDQGRVLERIAQTPLVLVSTYGMHDSVSHGSRKNSNTRSHNENSASTNNIS